VQSCFTSDRIVCVYIYMLQCVAVCCSVLQCVAVCCSVLQCVAVCCSDRIVCTATFISEIIESKFDGLFGELVWGGYD